MNPNQQQNQGGGRRRMIHESDIPSGEIKPNHLAASLTMAKGDIYYVTSQGIFARLPIGTVGQKLTVGSNGLPTWA